MKRAGGPVQTNHLRFSTFMLRHVILVGHLKLDILNRSHDLASSHYCNYGNQNNVFAVCSNVNIRLIKKHANHLD